MAGKGSLGRIHCTFLVCELGQFSIAGSSFLAYNGAEPQLPIAPWREEGGDDVKPLDSAETETAVVPGTAQEGLFVSSKRDEQALLRGWCEC